MPASSVTFDPPSCPQLVSLVLEETGTGTLPVGFTGGPLTGYFYETADFAEIGNIYALTWKAIDGSGTVLGSTSFQLTILPALATVTIDSDILMNFDLGTNLGLFQVPVPFTVSPVSCQSFLDLSWTLNPALSLASVSATPTVDVYSDELTMIGTHSANVQVSVTSSGDCQFNPVGSILSRPLTIVVTCSVTSVSTTDVIPLQVYNLWDPTQPLQKPTYTVVPQECEPTLSYEVRSVGFLTPSGLQARGTIYSEDFADANKIYDLQWQVLGFSPLVTTPFKLKIGCIVESITLRSLPPIEYTIGSGLLKTTLPDYYIIP